MQIIVYQGVGEQLKSDEHLPLRGGGGGELWSRWREGLRTGLKEYQQWNNTFRFSRDFWIIVDYPLTFFFSSSSTNPDRKGKVKAANNREQ